MLLPVKPVCEKAKMRADGTSLIFFNDKIDEQFTIVKEIIKWARKHNRAAWLRAVKADGLLWLNLSDLQVEAGKASPFVGVDVEGKRVALVPQTYLIDPSGKIIAKNVRGQQLQNLLMNTLTTGL